jgi:transposase InsO family protein
LPEERGNIISFALENPKERHRKLSFLMMDQDIGYFSPSTVYQVLKKERLIKPWIPLKRPMKRQDIEATGPNQVWYIDITYLKVNGRNWYLIPVLDKFSRLIVYWELCWSMTAHDVRRIVDFALEKEGLHLQEQKPKIISDNGTQLVAKSFKKFLKDLGIKHIRIAYRHPESQGRIEVFFKTLKYECFYHGEYQDVYEARRDIEAFIDYYNYQRLHQGIGFITPYQKHTGQAEAISGARKVKLALAKLLRKSLNRGEKVRSNSIPKMIDHSVLISNFT